MDGHVPAPSSQVVNDLDSGRMSAEAMGFLAAFADAFLEAGGPIQSRFQSVHATGSDRDILRDYVATAERSMRALEALRSAATRGDPRAVAVAWDGAQEASRANSSMNAALGLSACGTLESPAVP